MNKERINALYDAIFAIIITIMILEFKPPELTGWEAINTLIEPIFAYLVSFFILWVSWYTHHELFKNIEKISYKLYWLIGLNLLIMSFIPFGTAWIGRNLFDLTAELFYAGLTLLSYIVYHLLMEPAALEAIPSNNRPPIHNNHKINWTRNASLLFGVIVINWFPPIVVVVMFILSALHIMEHLRGDVILKS